MGSGLQDFAESLDPVCIVPAVLSGIGETEVLERIVNTLPRQGYNGSVVLSKQVVITDCEAFTNKVVVNGALRMVVLLFGPGAIFGTALTPGCVVRESQPTDLILIDCPLGACVPVPGSCAGDQCAVEACVELDRENLRDIDGDGINDLVEIDVCVRISATVARRQPISISPAGDNCP